MHFDCRRVKITGNFEGGPEAVWSGRSFNVSIPVQKWSTFLRRYIHLHFPESKRWISSIYKTSLKYVPSGQIANTSALVQVMAWHRTSVMWLSEPMMTLFTGAYICVTRPQYVNGAYHTLNTQRCHNANFVVTGGTAVCRLRLYLRWAPRIMEKVGITSSPGFRLLVAIVGIIVLVPGGHYWDYRPSTLCVFSMCWSLPCVFWWISIRCSTTLCS